MPAINFQPRFAELVESGRKTQTIRKSNRFKVGDTVQLYTGQRTKQCRKLGEGVVEGIYPFRITRATRLGLSRRKVLAFFRKGARHFSNQGERKNSTQLALEIAMADGFADAEEMGDFFEKLHGLPFDGWLIKWRLNR